jgi:tRNA G46 methylase TrmB
VEWDLRAGRPGRNRFEAYWRERGTQFIPPGLFQSGKPVWLEIGAGSGGFFVPLARHYPGHQLIAIERCRHRSRRLVRKAAKSGLENVAAFRGNAVPAVVHGIPDESVDRLYILYPCPFPKTSQRKNRWYLHPAMAHFRRILKRDGLLVWASDQEFYIQEAKLACERFYQLRTLHCAALTPNPYNELDKFPGGRSKFERSFLAQGLPCYELIVQKV